MTVFQNINLFVDLDSLKMYFEILSNISIFKIFILLGTYFSSSNFVLHPLTNDYFKLK